jgi:hypothetical protein
LATKASPAGTLVSNQDITTASAAWGDEGLTPYATSRTETTRNVRNTSSCSLSETYSPGMKAWLSKR